METSDHIISADKIKTLVEEINVCSIKWFKRFFKDEYDQGEFQGCCNDEEMKVIQECIDIFYKHSPDTNKDNILRAIVGYYYEIQVLPYYVASFNNYRDYNCLKKIYINDKVQDIMKYIMISNDKLTSTIRRKILNLNPEPFKGGKHKRKQKKRIQKTKKNNIKTRKTRKIYK